MTVRINGNGEFTGLTDITATDITATDEVISDCLKLQGYTSGYSKIKSPDVAGDQTYILPSVGGELVTKQSGGSVVGYQQGDWTPVLSVGAATVDSTSWTRIGNRVTVSGRFTAFTDTATSVTIEILPDSFPYFPVLPSFTVCIGSCFASNIGRQPTLVSQAVTGRARFCSTATNNSSNILTARHNDIGTGPSLPFTFSYLTEDTTFVPQSGATVS